MVLTEWVPCLLDMPAFPNNQLDEEHNVVYYNERWRCRGSHAVLLYHGILRKLEMYIRFLLDLCERIAATRGNFVHIRSPGYFSRLFGYILNAQINSN